MTARQHLLRLLAEQAELLAHEADRLSTFPEPDADVEPLVSELNRLVGLVQVIFAVGVIPESLHTADAVYRAQRAYAIEAARFAALDPTGV